MLGGGKKTPQSRFTNFAVMLQQLSSIYAVTMVTARFISTLAKNTFGRFYSPKTRMKSVLSDTTQNTCSYKAKQRLSSNAKYAEGKRRARKRFTKNTSDPSRPSI